MRRPMLRLHEYFLSQLRSFCVSVLADDSVEVDLTLRPDVDPNRTRITRFVGVPANWGPGTKAGRKEGRSWRGNKRKRDDEGEGEGLEMPGNAK